MLAAALTALSTYMEALYVPVLVMMGAMLMDYITGIAKAAYEGELSSRIATQGVIRKVGKLCLVATAMIVDYIIRAGLVEAGVELPFDMAAALMTCFWILINECISILENLDESGVPIPSFLSKALKVGKEKYDEEEKDE